MSDDDAPHKSLHLYSCAHRAPGTTFIMILFLGVVLNSNSVDLDIHVYRFLSLISSLCFRVCFVFKLMAIRNSVANKVIYMPKL